MKSVSLSKILGKERWKLPLGSPLSSKTTPKFFMKMTIKLGWTAKTELLKGMDLSRKSSESSKSADFSRSIFSTLNNLLPLLMMIWSFVTALTVTEPPDFIFSIFLKKFFVKLFFGFVQFRVERLDFLLIAMRISSPLSSWKTWWMRLNSLSRRKAEFIVLSIFRLLRLKMLILVPSSSKEV